MSLPRVLFLGALATFGAVAAARADHGADRWWTPDSGRVFPAQADYRDSTGTLRVLLQDGPMETEGHPFFAAIGPSGRACVTCHQPADGMSLSAESARERWAATGGKDPLFAAYDGSNCPTLPQGERASHSLLLDHGLIRIQRRWPPRNLAGKTVTPDFDIAVVRDPWGCNRGEYGPAKGKISVYRRPRPVANLKYLLAIGFAYDPKQGMPLAIDPESGQPMSGNLMADARAGTLDAQMRDAAATHLELTKHLTPAQMRQIVAFEKRLFVAQQADAEGDRSTPAGRRAGRPSSSNRSPAS